MCGVIDSIGDALGGIGDFIGNTVSGVFNTITHPFDNPLATLGLGLGAATGFGGLGEGLFGGLGSAAGGAAGASSIGGLESALGGASLFGPAAGTGTAIGSSTLGALGGGGLGLADLGSLGAAGAGLGGALGGAAGGLFNDGLGSAGLAGLGSLGETSTLGGFGGADVGGGLASATNTGLGAGDSLGAGVGDAAITGSSMTPGYSPNAALYGPNVAVPESGALSGTTGLSAEGAQLAGNATRFTMPTTLQTALYRANDALSPIGGLSGLKTAGNVLGIGSKLFGAYQSYQQQQARQKAYQNQLGQIDQLYSPDSAYAQQMAKGLAARDAAQGRRSQYGTRATELAAALTNSRAQALNSLNYTNLGQGAATTGTNQFNGFINAASGLGSLFGGMGQRIMSQPGTSVASSLFSLGDLF